MKINWKIVCKSPGYISLKKAYIVSVSKKVSKREKSEYLDKFNQIINRAKHHAYVNNTTIDKILNLWESTRTYYWRSYYNFYNKNFRKKHSNSLKPLGMKGRLKQRKKNMYNFGDSRIKREGTLRIIQEYHKINATEKNKTRWTKRKKDREKRMRRRNKENL